MDKRVKWVDYAKAISIFFVVLLHAGIPDPGKGLVRVFLIPLFFFLSGIFTNPHKYPSYITFIKQKGIRILIPYFFFNFITYLFWLLIGRHYGLDSEFNDNPVEPIFGILYSTSTWMKHYVPLWFLACLFMVESIYYFAFRKIKRLDVKLILLFLFGVLGYLNYIYNPYPLPWSIDIALPMIVFYGVGSLLKNPLLKMDKNVFRYLLLSILSFAVVFLMYKVNAEVKVFINVYGNYVYFFIGAFAGILFSVSMLKMLDIYLKSVRFLQFIGENTLIILALHLIAGSVVKAVSFYILDLPMSIYEITWVKIVYGLLSIIILIPVMLFFNRFLPSLIGKSKA